MTIKRLFLIIFLIVSLFYSCRKVEYSSIDYALSNRFFQAKANTKPVVKRIIAKMKAKNEQHLFINSLAVNDGFALWDKAIVHNIHKFNPKGNESKAMGNEDTIVLIPLVIDNKDYVNSFLAVKVSDNLMFKLFSGKDYEKYSFGMDWDTKMTADRVAAEIMNLEKEAFGHTIYKITDPRLFLKPGETRSLNEDIYASWGRSLAAPAQNGCSEINIFIDDYGFWSIDMCGDIWSGFDGGGDIDDNGGGSGSSSGGSSSGSSGPNGGSTGSGGSNSGNGNNNNGLGWHNVRNQGTFPKNPCKVVDSLMTTNNFPLYYKTLRDRVTTNHEKAFLFLDPYSPTTSYQEVNGDSGTLAVEINPSQPIDGAVHSHNNDSLRLSIFSFDDFLMLYKMFKNHQIKDTLTFTFGMVSDSTAYVMMITNPTNFTDFGNKFLSDKENENYFKYNFYNEYNISETNSYSQNEKSFLNALQTFNTGLSVFKSDGNISHFYKIKFDVNGNVTNAPCESALAN